MDKFTARFPQGKDEDICVSIREFKGQDWLDIRVYAALPGAAAEKVPTGKGIRLNISNFLPLKKALSEAENALKGKQDPA